MGCRINYSSPPKRKVVEAHRLNSDGSLASTAEIVWPDWVCRAKGKTIGVFVTLREAERCLAKHGGVITKRIFQKSLS